MKLHVNWGHSVVATIVTLRPPAWMKFWNGVSPVRASDKAPRAFDKATSAVAMLNEK